MKLAVRGSDLDFGVW